MQYALKIIGNHDKMQSIFSNQNNNQQSYNQQINQSRAC